MKEKQDNSEYICKEPKEMLNLLMQDIASITGLANSYELKKEAKSLTKFYLFIEAMYYGKQVYDNQLCQEAELMLRSTTQAIQEIEEGQSACATKSQSSSDEIEAFASAVYSPTTKGDFCRILGQDDNGDENASLSDE